MNVYKTDKLTVDTIRLAENTRRISAISRPNSRRNDSAEEERTCRAEIAFAASRIEAHLIVRLYSDGTIAADN
jgi:hypothetical protein